MKWSIDWLKEIFNRRFRKKYTYYGILEYSTLRQNNIVRPILKIDNRCYAIRLSAKVIIYRKILSSDMIIFVGKLEVTNEEHKWEQNSFTISRVEIRSDRGDVWTPSVGEEYTATIKTHQRLRLLYKQ